MSITEDRAATGRVFPTLRDPEAQFHFERDGIVVLPVLEVAEALALRAQVLEALPANPGPFLDLFRNAPPPLRKQIDRLVRDALEERVGEIFVDHDFWSAALLVKPPGDAGRVDLHTDWNMVDEDGYRSGLIWIALGDTTEENGGLVAVPGTNRLDVSFRGLGIHYDFDAPDVQQAIAERTVRVDVPIGHGAIWDNRLLHGSGPNHATEWRVAAALGFKPRRAQLFHIRRTPDGVARRYAIDRQFFLDYEPFVPSDRPTGPHVLAEEPLADDPWTPSAADIASLGVVEPVFGSVDLEATSAPAPAPAPATGIRWIDIRVDEVEAHPTALADIAARRLDGMTVSGVFTPDECARAVAALERNQDHVFPAIFGRMLGMSLANVAAHSPDPGDRTVYLDEVEELEVIHREAFGFDPFARLGQAVAPMAGGLTVTTPAEGGRHYLAGNVRWMEPGGGGLPAHVGNEFAVQSSPVGAHIRTVTRIRDHYSWFVILQAPDAGGALSVFDIIEGEYAPEAPQWGEGGRRDDDFDHIPCLKVAPEAGTLVLFGGGWRWHRVDKVFGTRPRITYGGFAGPSTDGRELHCWF